MCGDQVHEQVGNEHEALEDEQLELLLLLCFLREAVHANVWPIRLHRGLHGFLAVKVHR